MTVNSKKKTTIKMSQGKLRKYPTSVNSNTGKMEFCDKLVDRFQDLSKVKNPAVSKAKV